MLVAFSYFQWHTDTNINCQQHLARADELGRTQKIPCTFEVDVPGLGYLDGNDNADMKAGTKLELPIWLAEMLAVRYVLLLFEV